MAIPSNLTPAQIYANQFISTVNFTLKGWNNILVSGSIAPSGSIRVSIPADELQNALSSSYQKIQSVIAAGQ